MSNFNKLATGVSIDYPRSIQIAARMPKVQCEAYAVTSGRRCSLEGSFRCNGKWLCYQHLTQEKAKDTRPYKDLTDAERLREVPQARWEDKDDQA